MAAQETNFHVHRASAGLREARRAMEKAASIAAMAVSPHDEEA